MRHGLNARQRGGTGASREVPPEPVLSAGVGSPSGLVGCAREFCHFTATGTAPGEPQWFPELFQDKQSGGDKNGVVFMELNSGSFPLS